MASSWKWVFGIFFNKWLPVIRLCLNVYRKGGVLGGLNDGDQDYRSQLRSFPLILNPLKVLPTFDSKSIKYRADAKVIIGNMTYYSKKNMDPRIREDDGNEKVLPTFDSKSIKRCCRCESDNWL
jgi:hypothetical protein